MAIRNAEEFLIKLMLVLAPPLDLRKQMSRRMTLRMMQKHRRNLEMLIPRISVSSTGNLPTTHIPTTNPRFVRTAKVKGQSAPGNFSRFVEATALHQEIVAKPVPNKAVM